ncbi:MAG TPA: GTP cyclohydrolase II [Gemmatimonadales bacterium]|nr:GTP cyclohydrolase II [Gemmatimonadales bacterium]
MPGIQRVAASQLPTRYGEFHMIVYRSAGGLEHVALLACPTDRRDRRRPALVRVHSECITGDAFGSARCDCGQQLDASLRYLQRQGSGILLYLRQEGRGIGLGNKIRAYALQDRGYDTVEANLALGLPEDARDYAEAAAMLADLGIRQVHLLTNNPAKIAGLERHGIVVVDRIPLEVASNSHNARYLSTKRDKMGHLLTTPSPPASSWERHG